MMERRGERGLPEEQEGTPVEAGACGRPRAEVELQMAKWVA